LLTRNQVREKVIPDRSHHGRDKNKKPKRKMKTQKPTRYKLRQQDIDPDPDGYILNLPAGYQFRYDPGCHVRGFDTMKELRDEARTAVIPCSCKNCLA
jgi:hypothetical protein